MSDPFNLDRFVAAQAGAYDQALAELRTGDKRSHWMWFIFPQIAGLGLSEMARRYAIGSLEEARAYLDHPILGPRLLACVEALAAHRSEPAERILGGIDAMKLRSSLTLFREAAPEELCFQHALDDFFHGAADDRTLIRLEPSRAEVNKRLATNATRLN